MGEMLTEAKREIVEARYDSATDSFSNFYAATLLTIYLNAAKRIADEKQRSKK
jgi:hypothetical protein